MKFESLFNELVEGATELIDDVKTVLKEVADDFVQGYNDAKTKVENVTKVEDVTDKSNFRWVFVEEYDQSDDRFYHLDDDENIYVLYVNYAEDGWRTTGWKSIENVYEGHSPDLYKKVTKF